MNEIIDADKFVLEQVYRPYQSLLGFEKTLKKQPFDNAKTIALLGEDTEWARLTLDRIKRCNFKFSQWVNHPVINVIRYKIQEKPKPKKLSPRISRDEVAKFHNFVDGDDE